MGYFAAEEYNRRLEAFVKTLPAPDRAPFASIGISSEMRWLSAELTKEMAALLDPMKEGGSEAIKDWHVRRIVNLVRGMLEEPWIPEMSDLRQGIASAVKEREPSLAEVPRLMAEVARYLNPESLPLFDPFHERREKLVLIVDDIIGRREVDVRRGRGERVDSWKEGMDDSVFKEDIGKHAKTYVDNAWMHTPALTNLIAVSVLDAELLPLRREAADPIGMMMRTGDPAIARFVRIMEMPDEFDRIRIWARRILVTLGWLLAFALLVGENPILGILLGAFLAWRGYRRRKIRAGYMEIRNEHVSSLRTILEEMQEIRDEIATGAYGPERVKERLKELEGRGGYVASILYDVIGCGLSARANVATS